MPWKFMSLSSLMEKRLQATVGKGRELHKCHQFASGGEELQLTQVAAELSFGPKLHMMYRNVVLDYTGFTEQLGPLGSRLRIVTK